MRAYIISIVTASMICAIARGLLGNKTAVGRIANLVSGILLAVTVIAPLCNVTFNGLTDYWSGLSAEAEKYADQGVSAAEKQKAHIIKSQCEAYILDKANRMGLQIAVEVELDGYNGNVPCGVVVSGNVSPYAQKQMASYIEDTLGIGKEQQRWK